MYTDDLPVPESLLSMEDKMPCRKVCVKVRGWTSFFSRIARKVELAAKWNSALAFGKT